MIVTTEQTVGRMDEKLSKMEMIFENCIDVGPDLPVQKSLESPPTQSATLDDSPPEPSGWPATGMTASPMLQGSTICTMAGNDPTDAGPSYLFGEPDMSFNQRVATKSLLIWPSINALTQEHFNQPGVHPGEFHQKQDQNRRDLLSYAVAEGPYRQCYPGEPAPL